MKVRAKFICQERTELPGDRWNVKLTPVTANSDEDRKFWNATPFGVMELNSITADAAATFEPGKSYYFDIIPAE